MHAPASALLSPCYIVQDSPPKNSAMFSDSVLLPQCNDYHPPKVCSEAYLIGDSRIYLVDKNTSSHYLYTYRSYPYHIVSRHSVNGDSALTF